MENIKAKVLIVDDDKFLLNMYAIKFSKAEFEVNSAISGEEALAKIKEGYVPLPSRAKNLISIAMRRWYSSLEKVGVSKPQRRSEKQPQGVAVAAL
jgi:DNA-binding NtrC family response regulator